MKIVGGIILVPGLVCFGLWIALQQIIIPYIYCVTAEFSEMPENDRELEKWIRTQPGIDPSTVHLTRKAKTLELIFLLERKTGDQSFLGRLAEKCISLGYGPSAVFTECVPDDEK
jgi:hypothetical protein